MVVRNSGMIIRDDDSDSVFHIAKHEDWQSATGHYVPKSFAQEGFIHFSYASQVQATAGRYYMGRDDLVLLQVPRIRLAADLADENLLGGAELFPHYYQVLARGLVVDIARIFWDEKSLFQLGDYGAVG